MWNKIYLIVLAAAILAMGVLLYLPYSWLQSITAPKDVQEHYSFYSHISWIFLLVSSIALLLLGNVVLWITRKSWALWVSLSYFAVFMAAYTFWLETSFFKYKQSNNLETGLIAWSPLYGVVLIALAAVIVFFNQYLVKRAQNKMFPSEQTIESLPEESSVKDENI